MKHNDFFAVLLVSTIIASVSPANAEPYLGLGVGADFYKVDLTELGGDELDESTMGSKFYGGYAFNKYFAAEAAYYSFAKASIGGIQVTPGGPISSADASMQGIGAYAVASWPVNRELALMAKLGVLRWDADLRVDNTYGANDGTDAAFGLAASFAFTREFLGTVEWEYFDSENPQLSMISAGFRYNFR